MRQGAELPPDMNRAVDEVVSAASRLIDVLNADCKGDERAWLRLDLPHGKGVIAIFTSVAGAQVALHDTQERLAARVEYDVYRKIDDEQ